MATVDPGGALGLRGNVEKTSCKASGELPVLFASTSSGANGFPGDIIQRASWSGGGIVAVVQGSRVVPLTACVDTGQTVLYYIDSSY